MATNSNQGTKMSSRCVQPPEIHVADIVQKLLIRAVTKICQDYVKFSGFVLVTGNLKLNIDDEEIAFVTLNESVHHPPQHQVVTNRFDSRETLQPITRVPTLFKSTIGVNLLNQAVSQKTTDNSKISSADSSQNTRSSENIKTSSSSNIYTDFSLENSVLKNNLEVRNHLQNLINESQKFFDGDVSDRPLELSAAGKNGLESEDIRNHETSRKLPVVYDEDEDATNVTTDKGQGPKDASTMVNENDDDTEKEDDTVNDDDDDDIALADLIRDAESGSDTEVESQSSQTPIRTRSTRKNKKKQYACSECPFSTNQPRMFKEHKKRHKSQASIHVCLQCNKSFLSAGRLHNHMTSHKMKFKCSDCQVEFAKKLELKKHLKEEHDITGYSCDWCPNLFSNRTELQSHLQDAHNHICSICGESFTRVVDLHRHRTANHCKEMLQCKVCNKVCSSKRTLRKHMTRHKSLKDRSHACDICGKVFTAQSTLYHHKRGVHSDEKPYKCKFCDKCFNFHHSLKLHILHHNGARPHQCPHCSKSYLTATHLKSHVDAIHNPKKYKCTTCGKNFPYESSLKMHMMLHKGERPFNCAVCNNGFVSKSALKAHEKTAHTTGKMFQCSICQKTYKTEGLLRAHERRHTDAGSRFMCDICGHTFMYKSNLDAHIVTHGSERRYECYVCKKSFKTNATLYSHQLVHKTETPYRCCICSKEFKSKERLAAHEKRHSGLKPFTCEICQRSFPDKGGLTKHKKTVHSEYKRFACMVCGKTCSRSDNLRVHMKTHGDTNMLKADSLIKRLDNPDDINFLPTPPTQKAASLSKQSKERSNANMPASIPPLLTSGRSISDQNCQILSEMSAMSAPLSVNPLAIPSSCVQSSMMNLASASSCSGNSNHGNLNLPSNITQSMGISHHNQMVPPHFNERISLNQNANLHPSHNLTPVSGENSVPINPVVLPLMNQQQNQSQQSGPDHEYVTAANSVLYMQYGPYFSNFPY